MAFNYNNNNWSLSNVQSGRPLPSYQVGIMGFPFTQMPSIPSHSNDMSFEAIPEIPTLQTRTSTLHVDAVEAHFGCSIAGEWQDAGDHDILEISDRKIIGRNKVGYFVWGQAAPCINLDNMLYTIMFNNERNTMILCSQFLPQHVRTLNRLPCSKDKVNNSMTPPCRVPVSNRSSRSMSLTSSYNSLDVINYERKCSVGSYSSCDAISFERKCSVASDTSTGMSRREQIQICSRNVANLLAQKGDVFNRNPDYSEKVKDIENVLRSPLSTDEERDEAVRGIYEISQWKVKENDAISISNALLDPNGHTCGRIQAKTQTSLIHCYGFLLLCQREGIYFSDFNMCPAKGKKKSNLKGFHVSFRCTEDDMKKMVLLQHREAPKTDGRSYGDVVAVKIDNQKRFASDKNWVPIVEALA